MINNIGGLIINSLWSSNSLSRVSTTALVWLPWKKRKGATKFSVQRGKLSNLLIYDYSPMGGVCLVCGRGPVSLCVFSDVFQIQWKWHSALIKVVMKWSLWNFAHGMTAVMSWHVQNFVAMWYPTVEWSRYSKIQDILVLICCLNGTKPSLIDSLAEARFSTLLKMFISNAVFFSILSKF